MYAFLSKKLYNIGQIPYIICVYSCKIMISTIHISLGHMGRNMGTSDLKYCCWSNIH